MAGFNNGDVEAGNLKSQSAFPFVTAFGSGAASGGAGLRNTAFGFDAGTFIRGGCFAINSVSTIEGTITAVAAIAL